MAPDFLVMLPAGSGKLPLEGVWLFLLQNPSGVCMNAMRMILRDSTGRPAGVWSRAEQPFVDRGRR